MIRESGNRALFIISFILICGFGAASGGEYSGTVIDRTTREPIEGVFVSIGHTEHYTFTDSRGRFSLSAQETSLAGRRPAAKGAAMNARWNFRLRTLDLGGAPGVSSVSVYSLNGRRVFGGTVPQSRVLPLPKLPMGVYLLELRGSEGLRVSSRVVLSDKNSSFNFRSSAARSPGVMTQAEFAASTVVSDAKLIFRHDDYRPLDMVLDEAGTNMEVRLRLDERSVVFNQAKVHEYRFTVAPANRRIMETRGCLEEYVPAALVYEGQSHGEVALRYKGSNYSLPRCFGSAQCRPPVTRTCPKVSFKVKFSEYDENKRFYSMKRLNLHAMNADPKKMRDMLAYKLYREMGIHAPRTSFANVYVNDTLVGLFVAVEEIDGRFASARWPEHGDGNVYKERWPSGRVPVDYFNDSTWRNVRKSNRSVPESEVSVQRMIDFARAIDTSNAGNFVQNLSPFMDFDHFLRYMVVDVAINNWDGIRGWYSSGPGSMWPWANNHNYFLYEEENPGGKIWLVPWDMDNTFYEICRYFEPGRVPNWNIVPQNCNGVSVDGSFIRPPNCDKLTGMMAELFWDRYVRFGEQFLRDQFASRRLIDKIDRTAQLIAESVRRDPVIDEQRWRSDVDRFKEYLPNLAIRFSNHLHSIVSQVDTSGYLDPYPHNRFLSPVLLNNFEFTPSGNMNWVQRYHSQNTEVSVTHNTQSPLYGGADLRFDFTFRPTATPRQWDIWCLFQAEFETPADFSNLREIHIAMRADRPRNVRIAFGNHPVYSDTTGGRVSASSEYGWDGVPVSAQTQTVILKMMDLRYPDWADRRPDIKEEVLRSVRTLIFSPGVRGQVYGDGFLTVQSDVGFLQVDNIRFVY